MKLERPTSIISKRVKDTPERSTPKPARPDRGDQPSRPNRFEDDLPGEPIVPDRDDAPAEMPGEIIVPDREERKP